MNYLMQCPFCHSVKKPNGDTLNLRLQRVELTALSMVLSGRAGISPMMALRIEHWLGDERGGSAAESRGYRSNWPTISGRLAAQQSAPMNRARFARRGEFVAMTAQPSTSRDNRTCGQVIELRT
jgi:hypothetical protein